MTTRNTSSPAAPTPDEKDWTWVLKSSCPECGFEAGSVEPSAVARLLRSNTEQWIEQLRRGDVADRPSTQVWSPLEYACHVRDVHVLFLERLEMMLNEDGPHYPNWDQDQTAIARGYHEAEAPTVAIELRAASDALAARFDSVDSDGWARTGYRGDGAEFTVATFAQYFIHDPVHHLHDVGETPD
jgi:hypothetical protein